MRNWFFLIVRVLCCILAISSAASAKDNLLGQDAEVSKVATLQPCAEGNASGTVCAVDGEGKELWKGKVISPNEYSSLTNLITTLNSELRKRDKQHAQLQGELRQRDRELDKRDTMLTQLRDEVTAYRQKVLDLEERKLVAQDKHTGVLEQQNQHLSEQVEATHANTAAQARIATGVLFVLPAALVVGLLISAFVVRGSVTKLSETMSENTLRVFGDLQKSLEEASERLNKRLKEMNTTWQQYFVAEAKKQGLDYPPEPVVPVNGHGHHAPHDTIPPGGLSVQDIVASLSGKSDPPLAGASESASPAPTFVEVANESKESVSPGTASGEESEPKTDLARISTDEHLRSLDATIGSRLGGPAAQYAKNQPDFPIMAPGNVSLGDTVVEKPGFFARLFGRRGASSAPSIA